MKVTGLKRDRAWTRCVLCPSRCSPGARGDPLSYFCHRPTASPAEGRVRRAQLLKNGILVFWLGRSVSVAPVKRCLFSPKTWIWGREGRRPQGGGQDLQGMCQGSLSPLKPPPAQGEAVLDVAGAFPGVSGR